VQNKTAAELEAVAQQEALKHLVGGGSYVEGVMGSCWEGNGIRMQLASWQTGKCFLSALCQHHRWLFYPL